jgi:hypothetical protein
MEKIMRAQTMGDPEKQKFMSAKKIFELNPRHPIIAELAKRVNEGGEAEASAKDLAWLLFDAARLNSGFEIQQVQTFAERLYRLMQSGLRIDSLELLPEAELPPAPAKEEEAEAKTVNLDTEGLDQAFGELKRVDPSQFNQEEL